MWDFLILILICCYPKPRLLLKIIMRLTLLFSKVALRNFLGDPWPRMVMHPGGNAAEDRMTLIEAINEATRLGSGFGHTRNQEAQR